MYWHVLELRTSNLFEVFLISTSILVKGPFNNLSTFNWVEPAIFPGAFFGSERISATMQIIHLVHDTPSLRAAKYSTKKTYFKKISRKARRTLILKNCMWISNMGDSWFPIDFERIFVCTEEI